MLVKIEMEIEGEGLNTNMGSLFHGYIMQNIQVAHAEYLHYNQTNPFTSCIYQDKESKKYFWRITTFNKKAYDMIITYFLENNEKNIYLENKGIEISLKSFSMIKTSFEELFLNDEKKEKIMFLTPTAFKSNGKIQIFPNVATLLQGVINKINLHSDTITLEDENIINEILEKVYIDKYILRSQNFYLEKIKIKGFVGNMELKLGNKNEELQKFLSFLIKASEYTGLGIKTSLGMGGIKIE